MCGIAGILSFRENNSEQNELNVRNALSRLRDRGPNAKGIYKNKNVVLGHTRLSVIDTSKSANQPMTDPSGRYTIVYNGEIYNYKQLRKSLESEDVKFDTSSDTEVLLYSYIRYGAKCLKDLNGFFAFAIYDKTNDSLFLARDRFGIKPLLIYEDDEKFVFASEMKALVELGIEKTIDRESLNQFLTFNYVPSPFSIFENVRKVEPGTFLIAEKEELQSDRYFQLEISSWEHSYEDAKARLRELMNSSVSMRLNSDVPLGSFLSGGIDSSVISMLASKKVDNLKTFSIGYADEPFFDETQYAELVADHIGTDHTVFELTNSSMFEELDEVLDYMDEPFADSSALPVNILSRLAGQDVTVSLSGDGADEIFGGYNKYKAEYLIRNSGTKSNLVSSLAPLWSILPKSRNTKFSNKIRQLEKFAKGRKLTREERYIAWCAISSTEQVSSLLRDEYKVYNGSSYLQGRNIVFTELLKKDLSINGNLLADVNLVLQSDMLHKVDSMSMAHSLEVRVPFLDHKVVEFAFSLPESYKINKSTGKRILKEAYRENLPDEIFDRPKHGFEVPLLKWLRNELDPMVREVLSPDYISQQGIFESTFIENLIKKLHSGNPEDSHARIWALIVFQKWYAKYMS